LTKINLLPPEKIKAKKARAAERSYAWILIVLPLIVLIAMGAWYFSLNSKVNDKNKALAAAKTELTDWQAKNQQLQQYKARQQEIARIAQTAITALSNRVYWARILNDIAILCPTDIWLASLSGTSSNGTGNVQFQGFALQCPNRNKGGTFIFYPDYRPVAGWLDRMALVPEFQRIWLSSAQPQRQGVSGGVTPEGVVTGAWVISFSSQATLNPTTATIGSKGSTGSSSSTPSTPSSTPTTPSSTPSGGEAK
jgi:Tfp pilus assembly protein PilN